MNLQSFGESNLAPFIKEESERRSQSPFIESPVVARNVKKAVQANQQTKFWKMALVALLFLLLLYVFYRLYRDSTSKIVNVSSKSANDLVRQGINLKNFMDMV